MYFNKISITNHLCQISQLVCCHCKIIFESVICPSVLIISLLKSSRIKIRKIMSYIIEKYIEEVGCLKTSFSFFFTQKSQICHIYCLLLTLVLKDMIFVMSKCLLPLITTQDQREGVQVLA